MKKRLVLFACILIPLSLSAQQPATAPVLKPGSNLVIENIPSIPMAIAEETERYGEYRAATLFDWHPLQHSILIGTRFGDTQQVHAVAIPAGTRRQLTFFPDRVLSAEYLPDGNSFLFLKDIGGGEWYQIYRDDLASGKITLLTDGSSRNNNPVLAHHSTRLVFTSTRRNNKDTDLWIMDASDPASARMLVQVEGGGWRPLAWSPDNRNIVVQQYISINESYLWMVDAQTGEKKQLTPAQPGNSVAYSTAKFSHDGKSLYVICDRDSEFQRLTRFDLATMTPHYLTTSIPWNVEAIDVSEDGRFVAFATNENGLSRLYLLNTSHDNFRPLPVVPSGVIGRLRFHPDGHDLAFDISSSRSPEDVWSIDVRNSRLDRWTESETGGLNAAHFVEPRLISWKSFDGRSISGYLYQPDPQKFPGPRPVVIFIHGGPEGQFRPAFFGQQNYLINELGLAIIAPNVRGSDGYGKTFLKLDNGFHREDTYKDVGALLDWIKAQPELNSQRIMVTGGSYGGHMTWAVAAFYNDRIRCALPYVGMSNLVTFLEHTESYRRDLRRVEYGDERNPEMRAYLERIAPMNHLDSMHKPIFAVVGRNDPRVPWSESRQIIDKLKAEGTPTWFLMANDEGHGYAKKTNRDFLFDAEVLFIREYLLN